MGIEGAAAVPAAMAALELGKGAIIGAMLIGAAFLAGVAVLRRSSAALYGLLLVASACILQAIWLKIVPAPANAVVLLLEGAFAAAALLFLSATIVAARSSQLMGGILFAGAVSIIGVGFINMFLGGEASGLQRIGLIAVAVVGLGLSAIAGARGDIGARLILPGAVLAASAPFLFGLGGASGALSLAPQALFAVGVLLASLVALADFGPGRPFQAADLAPAGSFNAAEPAFGIRHDPARVSENRLADVLDYAGVAVWDWDRSGSHQSASFARLMGADCDGAFTPEAFREFVHAQDAGRVEDRIFAAHLGDGGFDESVRLVSGRKVRLRGARAMHRDGALERIVLFLEEIVASPQPVKRDIAKAAPALVVPAVIAPAAIAPPVAKAAPEAPKDDIVMAFDRGEIVAAFQPIVSFDDKRVCGAEALVRWPAAAESKTSEEIVRSAMLAGKAHALSSLMLSAAARHAAERIMAGDKGYFAAFNVSLSQMREASFVDDVKTAIGDYKLPKGALVLELTEGERLVETPKISETFRKLKSAGAALAYDDFGTGFSSLSNLHKYEFDYLKIDKSFLDDIVANGGKKKIVAALARLGRDFDMTVIAEGVESKEAAEVARSIGCRMGQGFYLGEPQVQTAGARQELAVVEVVKGGGGDEIVLDRTMSAPKPSKRLRRRFVRA